MFGCTREAKYAAYKAIIRIHQAARFCRDSNNLYLHDLGDSIQLQHTRLWSVEVAGVHLTTLGLFPPMIVNCCSQLCLPFLQSRRNFLSVSLLSDIYHQQTSISFNNHCTFNSVASTRSHHLHLSLHSI